MLLFSLVALPAAVAGEDEIRGDIRYLASDALEGRATGSAGEKAAAEHIAKAFAQAGLAPARQDFEFLAGVSAGAATELEIATGKGTISVKRGPDGFVPLGFSSNGKADAELLFLGFGITAPELGYDDYRDLDVRGKAVVVLDRVPRAGNPHGQLVSEGLTRYGQIRYKAMNAREHGAVAMLVVSSQVKWEEDPALHPLVGNTTHGDAGILVADLRRSLAREVFERSGRSLDSVQEKIELDLAPQSLALPGARARLAIELLKDRKRAANVIAVRPGSDPKLAEEAIVVGAHFDHLGRGEVGGSLAESAAGKEIHNGADDNASGTAALIEVARLLPKTRRTVIFAAFTGEEMGMLGSAHFVKEPPHPIDRTVAMINMDMVGRLEGRKLTIGGMGTAREWPEVVSAAAALAGVPFSAQDDGYGPSDHSSFYGKQVPVLFLFTGAHSDYHKPSDDWEAIDVTGTARIAGFARNLVIGIDALDARPTHLKTKGTPHGADLEPGRGPQVYLGTIPDYSESEEPGVRLSGVREGSPAEAAGLRAGDRIIRFDGREVRDVQEYTVALFAKKPGDDVEIIVRRGGEDVRLHAKLGRKGKPAN